MARAHVTVVALSLAALVAGCAGIPTSGEVVQGDPVRDEDPAVYVGSEAPPPQPGADERSIVAGFIDAMASYEPSYRTARLFLTPDADTAWEPRAGTTVYDPGTLAIRREQTGQVVVELAVVGTVDPAGAYVRQPAGTTERYQLGLERVDGEWRITTPPPGLIVSNGDFDNEYRAFYLYYFDSSFEVLVPEPVFLPVNEGARGSLTTLLAERLLAGPSPWLSAAVRTAFPGDTQLGVDSVPLERGRVSVELTGEVSEAPRERRTEMLAQLAWTLRQVRGVEQISVTADGLPLLAGEPTQTPVDAFSRYDVKGGRDSDVLHAVTPSGVVRVGTGLEPVDGPLGSLADVQDLAVDFTASGAVAVSASGTELVWAPFSADAELATVAEGSNLVSPSWDRTGLVWVVDQRPDGSRLLAGAPGQAPAVVPVTGLDGVSVERVAISPDGTRIAVVAGGEVRVGVVVRDSERVDDVHVDRFRRLVLDGPAADVAWIGTTDVAVLGAPVGDGSAGGELSASNESSSTPLSPVYVVELSDNQVKPAGQVPEAQSLSAISGSEQISQRLAVGTVEGRLLLRNETLRWDDAGGAWHPAYPG